MLYLDPEILKALEFAAVAHKEQMRKNPTDVPYVSHVAAVGLALSRGGFEKEVVIAGILHDVVEDTSFSAGEIKDLFGEKVEQMVLGVTENKQLPWDERQKAYNEHLKTVTPEVLAISAADLLANRLSLISELEQGRNPWTYFSKTPQVYAEKRLFFDSERIGIIKQGLNHPLIVELETAEARVAELTKKLEW